MKEIKYTKEDWINGKVALEWENDKAEKINKFFKQCTKYNDKANGYNKYYVALRLSIKGAWSGRNSTDLPIVKIDDIIMEEEFILPSKWAIKSTPSIGEELNKYATKITKRNYRNDEGYFHFPDYKYLCCTGAKLETDYTEITYEQFLKYVLKMEQKKIIGYKLIKPEYLEAIKNITDFQTFKFTDIERDGKWAVRVIPQPSACYRTLEKAGVLDIWFTPVFEPEKPKEKVISMGEFSLTVKSEGIFHKSENITEYVERINTWWKNVMNEGNLKFGNKNYDFLIPASNITLMKTGCENKQSNLNSWLTVWKEYQLIKG